VNQLAFHNYKAHLGRELKEQSFHSCWREDHNLRESRTNSFWHSSAENHTFFFLNYVHWFNWNSNQNDISDFLGQAHSSWQACLVHQFGEWRDGQYDINSQIIRLSTLNLQCQVDKGQSKHRRIKYLKATWSTEQWAYVSLPSRKWNSWEIQGLQGFTSVYIPTKSWNDFFFFGFRKTAHLASFLTLQIIWFV
jgi:hypothetical protein